MKSMATAKQGGVSNLKSAFGRVIALLIVSSLGLCLSGCSPREGKVLNAEDNTPIAGAAVFHNGETVFSDETGRFKLTTRDPKKPISVKAAGFRQASVPVKRYLKADVRLTAFQAKAVYLSHAGIGAAYLRDPALQLIADTDLNAVVVDVKGQRGLFSFSWEIPLGHKIGAFSKITINDPDAFIREMHEKGIYVIGRVCVFKDEALANNKKEWAVLDPKTEKPFRDADKIPWVDPFLEEVWEYNLAIAKAAAEVGFDEIQFDYLRFPEGKHTFSKENTAANRCEVVTGFLKRARKELEPYNVFLSVAVSGNALWKEGDAGIGQNLETIMPLVDYLSPYVYPSDLPARVLNLSTNSAVIPGEAVAAALNLGFQRSGNQPGKIRPWLQGFRDYSRLRREFKGPELGEEIAAAETAGAAGWILFNPENKYPDVADAFRKAKLVLSSTNETALVRP